MSVYIDIIYIFTVIGRTFQKEAIPQLKPPVYVSPV